MESRQSGRADGRGWGGRGDSGPRRGASRGEAGADELETGSPAPEPDAPQSKDDPRMSWREARASAGAPSSLEDEHLRGAGETPWVRAEPRARAGERAGAQRASPPLPDLSALLVALEGMRGMVPRELTSQINALIREVLLTLRALIDWYLERLEPRPGGPEVEEIPID